MSSTYGTILNETGRRRVTRLKARLGCAWTILVGHEIKSEVGLCMDHSGGSRDQKRGWVAHGPFWKVTRSKARLGGAWTILVGHEIKSEVGLCMDHAGGSRERKRGCFFFRNRLRPYV